MKKPIKARAPATKKDSSRFNIIAAVKRDHEDLKKFIEVMKDEDVDIDEKEEAYSMFSELLKSHASSEEKALYQKCLDEEDLGIETNESFVEHQVATLLMEAIDRSTDPDRKIAQIKVLAESVEHHIEEEEDEFLPEVKKHFSSEELTEMAEDFLSLRRGSQRKASEENAGILERFVH